MIATTIMKENSGTEGDGVVEGVGEGVRSGLAIDDGVGDGRGRFEILVMSIGFMSG